MPHTMYFLLFKLTSSLVVVLPLVPAFLTSLQMGCPPSCSSKLGLPWLEVRAILFVHKLHHPLSSHQRVLFLSQPKSDMTKEKLVLKRFVFSSASIAALKAKYAEESSSALENRLYPSRVEALTALIYSRYIAATQVKLGAKKLHIVFHAVNLRTRMDPPLPEHSFGNISWPTSAILSSETGQALSQGLVGKLILWKHYSKTMIQRIVSERLLENSEEKIWLYLFSLVCAGFLYTWLTLAGESLYGSPGSTHHLSQIQLFFWTPNVGMELRHGLPWKMKTWRNLNVMMRSLATFPSPS